MGEVSYKGHRYPAEIIAHCVWLYHRFPLSFREVEELMLVRGVIVTYETIRQWCAKFGPVYAAGLRRRQPRPGDKWHLDEVFLTHVGKILTRRPVSSFWLVAGGITEWVRGGGRERLADGSRQGAVPGFAIRSSG